MSDNVLELGRHAPSVDSVIERLSRHKDKIKGITAIIEWEDGSCDIAFNTKSPADLTFEHKILGMEIDDIIRGDSD